MAQERDLIPPEARRIMVRFPEIFGRRAARALCYGFECGAGWYPLIERLCADLAKILQEDGLTKFQVQQVKEKLGGLVEPRWSGSPRRRNCRSHPARAPNEWQGAAMITAHHGMCLVEAGKAEL